MLKTIVLIQLLANGLIFPFYQSIAPAELSKSLKAIFATIFTLILLPAGEGGLQLN